MEESSRKRLFLISFAALFFEILMIRWVSSEIVVFGYFKNLILMGAFVGMGLGCSSAGEKESLLSKVFPYLILALVALLAGAQALGLTGINFVLNTDEFFWLNRADVVGSVGQLIRNAVWVIGIFFLIVSIFDALGQVLGRELAKHAPLKAYMANLGGSLTGVVVYSVLAFLKTSPFVWLLAGFASLLPFYRKPPQIAAMLVSLVIAFVYGMNVYWSPYFRISPSPLMARPVKANEPRDPTCLYITGANENIQPYQVGYHLNVNHQSYQHTIDLSDEFIKQHPELKQSSEYSTYNMPYDVKLALGAPGESGHINDVLVLGAGSGDDVAAALRHGVDHVDAVEIDPSIAELGKTLHPEHPYADSRVTCYINDARNYIASSNKKYDVVVFGFVDSHVGFSMLSSVRLDNFLYTKESLALVGARLKPDGLAALSFAAGPDWLRARLYQMVQEASGQVPVALHSSMSNPNSIIIIWGPGLTPAVRAQLLQQHKDIVIPVEKLTVPVELCSDDWPFLYQRARVLSSEYGWMLCLLILIAGSLTIARFRLNFKSFITHLQFFLLGAGFLLLETRAMLAVAVLFGSTWIVNSIVISLILSVAMMSNWIVSRFKNFNPAIAYAGLFASLSALYLIPLSNLAGSDLVSKVVAAFLIIGLPFAFAGLVFSSAFARTKEPDKSLGINIFGALLGGCLEYLSVVIGTRDLVLIAVALYALSLAAAGVLQRKAKTVSSNT